MLIEIAVNVECVGRLRANKLTRYLLGEIIWICLFDQVIFMESLSKGKKKLLEDKTVLRMSTFRFEVKA